MSNPSAGDRRWHVAIILAVAGAGIVLVTRILRGDSWAEFTSVAVYSVGWALLTFGVLYLLSKQFENWEWNRPDHDLVSKLKEGLDDDETG